jgi:hypothetical protein
MSAKNIFICYRRDDAEGYAGRLYDRLNARFPRRVFMDVTGISPGADFTRVIRDTVGSCHVLIAIIGRHWATMKDAADRRRLDLADDYVRHEIATALSRNITVIPVLVRGAPMPSREVLPPDLAPLSTRNALEITDGDFDHDVHRLIEVLENVCGEPRPVPRAATSTTGRNSCLIFAVIGILAVGGFVLIMFVLGMLAASTNQNSEGAVQPSSQPVYSQPPAAAPSTAQPAYESQPDAYGVNFNPVGHWLVTYEANGVQLQNALVLHANKTYQSEEETGYWDYSPAEKKLNLAGYLEITIERQEGNTFVGHGQLGYATFPIQLSRQSTGE